MHDMPPSPSPNACAAALTAVSSTHGATGTCLQFLSPTGRLRAVPCTRHGVVQPLPHPCSLCPPCRHMQCHTLSYVLSQLVVSVLLAVLWVRHGVEHCAVVRVGQTAVHRVLRGKNGQWVAETDAQVTVGKCRCELVCADAVGAMPRNVVSWGASEQRYSTQNNSSKQKTGHCVACGLDHSQTGRPAWPRPCNTHRSAAASPHTTVSVPYSPTPPSYIHATAAKSQPTCTTPRRAASSRVSMPALSASLSNSFTSLSRCCVGAAGAANQHTGMVSDPNAVGPSCAPPTVSARGSSHAFPICYLGISCSAGSQRGPNDRGWVGRRVCSHGVSHRYQPESGAIPRRCWHPWQPSSGMPPAAGSSFVAFASAPGFPRQPRASCDNPRAP